MIWDSISCSASLVGATGMLLGLSELVGEASWEGSSNSLRSSMEDTKSSIAQSCGEVSSTRVPLLCP